MKKATPKPGPKTHPNTVVLRDLAEARDVCLEDDGYDFDENAEEVAAERNQKAVFPEPNQLQIDLDTEEQYVEFQRRVRDFLHLQEYVVETHYSRSGEPHRHVTITFGADKVFTEGERICYQSVLGSDPVREFLNARRLLNENKHPTRLFEELDFVPAKRTACDDSWAEHEKQIMATEGEIPT